MNYLQVPGQEKRSYFSSFFRKFSIQAPVLPRKQTQEVKKKNISKTDEKKTIPQNDQHEKILPLTNFSRHELGLTCDNLSTELTKRTDANILKIQGQFSKEKSSL